MKSHQLDEILRTKPDTPVENGREGGFWRMEPFDGGSTWVGKWSGESPWERHTKGDEFLHVLKGEVEVIVLTQAGKKSFSVAEGNIFVVPKDHWHKQRAKSEVIVLGATPGVTDHSDKEPSTNMI